MKRNAKKANGNATGNGSARAPALLLRRRFPSAADLGLSRGEFATLERLSDPMRVQAYLHAIPCNHEIGGETVLSVREVLRQRRAHCIEGAMLAACAQWVHGETPWVLHLDCHESDFPHVVALFRRGGFWGAISKTNGAPLRYRDPIYRTLRELALSYFHEYSNRRGQKTLRSYSIAYDMRRLDPAQWVTGGEKCWPAHDRITEQRHFPLISRRQERILTKRDQFERQASRLVQYPRPDHKAAIT